MSRLARRAILGPKVAPASGPLDPAYKAATITLSNGDRTATMASTTGFVRSITPHLSGKWHFEFSKENGFNFMAGVIRNTTAATDDPTQTAANSALVRSSSGQIDVQGPGGVGTMPGGGVPVGEIVAVEVDLDGNLIYFQRQGQTRSVGYDISVNAGVRYAFLGNNGGSGLSTINTGQSAFVITPTAGFSAWG